MAALAKEKEEQEGKGTAVAAAGAEDASTREPEAVEEGAVDDIPDQPPAAQQAEGTHSSAPPPQMTVEATAAEIVGTGAVELRS